MFGRKELWATEGLSGGGDDVDDGAATFESRVHIFGGNATHYIDASEGETFLWQMVRREGGREDIEEHTAALTMSLHQPDPALASVDWIAESDTRDGHLSVGSTRVQVLSSHIESQVYSNNTFSLSPCPCAMPRMHLHTESGHTLALCMSSLAD